MATIQEDYDSLKALVQAGEASSLDAATALYDRIVEERQRLILINTADLGEMASDIADFTVGLVGLDVEILDALRLYILELETLLNAKAGLNPAGDTVVATRFNLQEVNFEVIQSGGIASPTGTLEQISAALEVLITSAEDLKNQRKLVRILQTANIYTEILIDRELGVTFWNTYVATMVALATLYQFAQADPTSHWDLENKRFRVGWVMKNLQTL